MELTQESLTNLLTAKKKTATCVARTNGSIVKTRRYEGGKVNVYNTYTENYIIPYFFNPFNLRDKIQSAKKKGIESLLGKLYPMQTSAGTLYGE